MKLAPLRTVESAHEESVWCVAWSKSSSGAESILLTGSLDETVKLWSGDDLSPVRTQGGHSLGVVAIAVDSTGSFAASSSLDNTVRVFDVESNSTIASIDCSPSESWSLAFHPQGSFLAVAGGLSNTVKIYDTSSWRLVSKLQIPTREEVDSDNKEENDVDPDTEKPRPFVASVAWNLEGTRVAAGCMDGSVALLDVPQGRFLHFLDGHRGPVRSLDFSPVDSRLLFTASDDSHVHMYDADSKALIAAISGHDDSVLSVACSPDGSALASGSGDGTVKLWDLSTRVAVQTMEEGEDPVWGVAFRPGGRGGRLASVSEDMRIHLYDFS